MTDQLPDDNPSAAGLTPFVPNEEWLDQFDTQCTETLLKRARLYAVQRARDLGWQMPGASAYDADELVDGIVRDTLEGVLCWNPSRKGLDQHLYDAVRVRVTRYAKRARKYPHESIDAVDGDGESTTMAELEAQLLADAPESTAETVARADETTRALQGLAANKPLVQQLLTAFTLGKYGKEEVMLAVNLTSAEYHNARRQLTRLVEQLPRHLCPREQKGA